MSLEVDDEFAVSPHEDLEHLKVTTCGALAVQPRLPEDVVVVEGEGHVGVVL